MKSGRSVDKIFVAKGDREGSITVIVAEAIKAGIPVVECERQKLDAMAHGVIHQGVIASAKHNGIYITWFDNNGFARAPETIISSTLMLQDKMAEKITLEYLNDQITWGAADMVGMEDGFIDFVQDDSRYIKNVPADIRAKMADLVEDIKQKKIEIN